MRICWQLGSSLNNPPLPSDLLYCSCVVAVLASPSTRPAASRPKIAVGAGIRAGGTDAYRGGVRVRRAGSAGPRCHVASEAWIAIPTADIPGNTRRVGVDAVGWPVGAGRARTVCIRVGLTRGVVFPNRAGGVVRALYTRGGDRVLVEATVTCPSAGVGRGSALHIHGICRLVSAGRAGGVDCRCAQHAGGASCARWGGARRAGGLICCAGEIRPRSAGCACSV